MEEADNDWTIIRMVGGSVSSDTIGCQTRCQTFNQLSNPFDNWFDKRLYRVYSWLSKWLYNPVCSFKTVVKPVVNSV